MSAPSDHLAIRYRQQRQLHVGILVFPEVEVLDFAGPFEVVSVAARIAAGELDGAPFRVSIVGAHKDAISARHGLQVLPHLDFAGAGVIDLLIVPGGVVTGVLQDAATLGWIAGTAPGAALVASVCTGAFLLARLGMLDGALCTTHWEDIADLRRDYPQLEVREDVAYVDNGRIVTSAGISAGIGMSLHLVERVLGARWADATARQMEYDWVSAGRNARR
jgi:transcriptional regulator GlxA family with amidase domain